MNQIIYSTKEIKNEEDAFMWAKTIGEQIDVRAIVKIRKALAQGKTKITWSLYSGFSMS